MIVDIRFAKCDGENRKQKRCNCTKHHGVTVDALLSCVNQSGLLRRRKAAQFGEAIEDKPRALLRAGISIP